MKIGAFLTMLSTALIVTLTNLPSIALQCNGDECPTPEAFEREASGILNISQDPDASNYSPRWSADGESLFFLKHSGDELGWYEVSVDDLRGAQELFHWDSFP